MYISQRLLWTFGESRPAKGLSRLLGTCSVSSIVIFSSVRLRRDDDVQLPGEMETVMLISLFKEQ